MTIEELKKLLKQDRITIEQKIEGAETLRVAQAELEELRVELEDKEDYVEEPADIDDLSEDELNAMKEKEVVAFAKSIGIDAKVSDRKADTIQAILKKQAEKAK